MYVCIYVCMYMCMKVNYLKDKINRLMKVIQIGPR